MVSQTLVIDDFLKLYRKKSPLLIDTRSEKEYEKAHIPVR
jgi:rhodanese-related sulfurtransferase